MKNTLVAQVLETIADLEEIKGEEAYKAPSYRRAAAYIHKMSEPIEDIAGEGNLQELPGVGKNIAAKIVDILERGTTKRLEKLLTEIPATLLNLLAIEGLGPKTASRLYKEAGVETLGDLEAALRDGRLSSLRGFGQKRVEVLKRGLQELSAREQLYLLSYAWPAAEAIAQSLRDCRPDVRAEVAGSVRRRKEAVRDLDIVASVPEEGTSDVARRFTGGEATSEVIAEGHTKCSIRLKDGMQVDLRIVAPEQFWSALGHFTGSKEHNAHLRGIARDHGMKINEYGVFRLEDDGPVSRIDAEHDIYRLMGMEYVPPELREDTGELEAATEGHLPELLEPCDMRGDLHVHTNWTDGIDSIEAMAEAARQRGYEYLAITDHSKALAFARGLDSQRLSAQGREIDALNERVEGITVLKGIEVDVMGDGSLDLDDAALEQCDLVVASIHSGFRSDEEQIMKRLEGACKNPHVDIIGHPSGRIIGHRNSYSLDISRLLDVACKTRTALEINASPDRLDITDQQARAAKKAGVKVAINTDAHSRRGLGDMVYGVFVARRGWLEKDDVINAMSTESLEEFLRR